MRHGSDVKRLAIIALICAGVFWGLGFPLGKLAMRETEAAHVITLRFLVAALAALPFAVGSARVLFRSPTVVLGGVLYGLAFLIQFEGLGHVSVALAALPVGAMPAMIAVMARILGEPVTPLSWVGVAAATGGAALIAGKPGEAGSPLGVILSIAALLVFMAWLVVLRRAPKPPHAMAIPAVVVIVGAATILAADLVLHGPPPLNLSAGAWAGLAAQGVLSTLLATAAWQFGLSRVGSATAGVFVNIEPLMGAALGVLMFGDRLTAPLIGGGMLILIGSFVVVRGERDAAPDTLADRPMTPA